MASAEKQGFHLSTDRKVSLSDAVIGIAATLLILDVKVPEGHSFSRDGMVSFLARVGDQLVACAVTFVLIGSYWMVHRRIVDHLKRSSTVVAWLNLLFLFCISLLPFATALLNAYPDDEAAVVLYGLTHIFCGGSLALAWAYASRRELTNCSKIVRDGLRVETLLAPSLCLLAIMTSTFSRTLAIVVFLAVPVLQIGCSLWIERSGQRAASPT